MNAFIKVVLSWIQIPSKISQGIFEEISEEKIERNAKIKENDWIGKNFSWEWNMAWSSEIRSIRTSYVVSYQFTKKVLYFPLHGILSSYLNLN